MHTEEEYKKLVVKYGGYSSWAIWDYKDENILSVIDESYKELHSNYIFLGLNISKPLKDGNWKNFHGGRHDRKLKYACNDTQLRGSYITDLFKGIPEANSSRFINKLSKGIVDKNVSFFRQEMEDIKLSSKSIFIVLGVQNSRLAFYFDTYFKKYFNIKAIYYYHYSYYRLTDKEWVAGLWNKLAIKENFDTILQRYKSGDGLYHK